MFEKKRGKRFLASVMALVMLLSLAPVGALAAENEDSQENTTVSLPADEANPKPVETGTANTNEETTPPPANEGIAVLPANNNNAPVALPETPVIVKPTEVLDQAFGVDSDTSKDNGIAEYKGNTSTTYSVSGPDTVKVNEEITLKCDGRHRHSWNIKNDSDKVQLVGNRNANTVTVKGMKEGSASVYCKNESNAQEITVTKAEYQAYFYVLLPNVNLPYEYNADEWWYGMGIGSIATERPASDYGLGTTLNDLLNTDKITYPESFPNLTIDGIIYTYDASATKQNSYSIVWHTVIVSNGANAGKNEYNKPVINSNNTGKSDRNTYHVDGTLVLNETEKRTVMFKCQYPTSDTDTFKEVTGYTVRVADGYQESELRQPDMSTINGYRFDGWYRDEACTDKVDFNGNGTVTKNVTYYGKYVEQKYNLSYELNGGTITSNTSDYTVAGEVYPDAPVVTPSVSKEGYTFDGWYTDANFQNQWTGNTMPKENLALYAKWTGNVPVDPTPDPTSDTDLVDAMYFVLMPGQGVPSSGVSQGVDKYFPNASNNGGVEGRNNTNGYVGKITKAATKLKGAQTTNGYFKGDGVDPDGKYLKNIGDLGYFNAANYNADGTYTGTGTLPTGMANFNMTNKSIVWYVIKKEGDVYHVDGYVKGVNIELKYFDEFNGQQIGEPTRLLSGDTATIQPLPSEVTHDGWRFAGWFTKDGTKYEVGKTCTLIDSLNLYAHWTTTYNVVTHFMDANGKETISREKSNLSGVHGTLLKDMVLPLNQADMDGITGNYVYVPSETKYSIGNGDKVPVGTTTFTTANTVIHQYYYLDETGKIGKDEENKPTDESDEIPDAWQHKVTFKVVNGKWNDDSSDNIVVYVNAKGKDGETLESKLTEAQIPAVGEKPNSGYRASGNWDKSLSADLKITGDTEFTFTYSRRSSGGSSRPSTPPTVDIPDNDVPTGLNGKDHYAYIIGYGNNDVRPQNNITRAEVATIFFRLLTDETREANMTKSNGYNDVKDGDWFCCAVSTLSKMGIIKGYEDGSFKPNDPISRAEFAAIAARFDPDGDKTPATFADVTSHWAKDEISIAANHGWIKGYEEGSFKPDQKITRAETMTLVNRVLNRLPEAKDDLHKDMKTWVDNMDETAWYYLAVQEATNSHYFKNKTSTKFEQWTDLRDTRDWSELEK